MSRYRYIEDVDGNELSQTDISDMRADEENIQEENIEPTVEMLDTGKQADNDEPVFSKPKTKKCIKIPPEIYEGKINAL